MAAVGSRFIWLNGELTPFDEARVNVTALEPAAAGSVYEGIRAYGSHDKQDAYIFRLDDHFARLQKSLKFVRLISPYSNEALTEGLRSLLRANECKGDAYIRLAAYVTIRPPGTYAVDVPAEVFITADPRPSNLSTDYQFACCVSTWMRIADNAMPPRIKAFSNYANSRLALVEAKTNGYDSAVILNAQGRVAEGPLGCIFIVRNGKLITPPLSSGILESITRETLLQLASAELNLPIVERDVDRTELYIADEAFFCGTGAEIIPITSIDRYSVGNGKIGEITRTIQRLYEDVVRGKDGMHVEWRTAVWS